ncbi:putative Ubiquitin-like domain superfamily, UBL3-like, ubiquitin domain-containing protein [Helianthus annuus]|nr:putative Ubiquitin-like domain superfamily, UBL3-like, ubiquitin domain-containing protein [Helianthus annuus]KAJ0528449.1 putative Ubiquitin-like domain superfamily, UBL3-like, ubiquitin domain-containing protein [Helianthus annuus]KAJ0695392.1 putative Ubiquitin-like domain superfamily, UBL3-like, ubiquitin domain-containing protein [Helianthus annuus]KAJ0698850.1 putative Ubiquitin-like domain superfamily, UBL3-like, ubiquitin domain-containing protein [Helianthus annuus]
MAAEELIEVKFRLADGTDIGPSKYSSVTTVGSLKEKIVSQWPKEVASRIASFYCRNIKILDLCDILLGFYYAVCI